MMKKFFYIIVAALLVLYLPEIGQSQEQKWGYVFKDIFGSTDASPKESDISDDGWSIYIAAVLFVTTLLLSCCGKDYCRFAHKLDSEIAEIEKEIDVLLMDSFVIETKAFDGQIKAIGECQEQINILKEKSI
jgi:hypothetical protein